MLGIHADLLVDNRQRDHADVFGENLPLRRQDFQSERLGHVSSAHFLDAALHVEVAFGNVVVLAVEDLLEAANGFLDGDLLARCAGEDLRRTANGWHRKR